MINDIKALTINEPELVSQLGPAFERYNEDQFVTAKLPGSAQQVVISEHSSLGNGRYYDVESSSSFDFDHTTLKASNVQSHVLEGPQAELVYVVYSPNIVKRGGERKREKEVTRLWRWSG